MTQPYSCHSNLRQEPQLEDHTALLRDEVFNVIPGTVNIQCGIASRRKKDKTGSEFNDDEVFHLSQVPDMPTVDSGHGHKVTFRESSCKTRVSIIYTPLAPSASIL